MRLPLIKYGNITLNITTILLVLSPFKLYLLLVRLGGYTVNLSDFYSYRLIGKLTVFLQIQEFSLCNLPVDSSTSTSINRTAFVSHLKAKVGNTLVKDAGLRVNLNLDGAPITSRTHTHPSHSQTSRLLTSSLSFGVPVPRATQCMRGV